MRAWQFTGTHHPFERVDIAEPTIEPGKVIIDVKAAGLCHTDVGLLEDPTWSARLNLPVVPGHETAGVISEVGDGVTDWKPGDRVAVWPLLGQGFSNNGAWEDRTLVPQDALVAIPDGVSFAQAAAATDAGMTAIAAVSGIGEVTAGMKVGIIGYGGIGQIGARVARLLGATVYVAEVNSSSWERALAGGAEKVSESILDFKSEKLDVIVDYAGVGTTTSDAIETVRFGGRVVLVGMGELRPRINTYALILGQVQLHGSMGGQKADIAAAMQWMASGDLAPLLTTIDFEEIGHGIELLQRGEAKGRLVAHVAD